MTTSFEAPTAAGHASSTQFTPRQAAGRIELGSAVPHDVDIDLLRADSDAEQLQDLFDVFSWSTLLALCWPVSASGEPAPALAEPGVPRWRTFKSGRELTPPHGLAPFPWSSARDERGVPLRNRRVHDQRFAYLPTSVQADGSVLWDQNGHVVHYETLVDPLLFDYVLKHELYCQEGQQAFGHRPVYMPQGLYWDKDPYGAWQYREHSRERAGAIALKLAWKILAGDDDPKRFYTELLPVPGRAGTAEFVQAGLLGIHVAHKTQSCASWIWSTFEHVDVLACDDALTGRAARALLRDPASLTPPNTASGPDSHGRRRTQVERVVPVLASTDAVNQRFRAPLHDIGSVWCHYRLLGTQRMIRTTQRHESAPVPSELANPVFETHVPKSRASALCAHRRAALGRNAAPQADFMYLLRDVVRAWPRVASLEVPTAVHEDWTAALGAARALDVVRGGLARIGRRLGPQARIECIVPELEWLLVDSTALWCLRVGTSSGTLDVFEPVGATPEHRGVPGSSAGA